jgi:hypothetical protein
MTRIPPPSRFPYVPPPPPNPLLVSLIGDEPKYVRQNFLVVGLLLSLLMFAGFVFFAILGVGNVLLGCGSSLACLVGISLPIVAAVMSANLTSEKTSNQEQFDLLRLTLLKDEQFVGAYFWAAVYRLRYPLLLFGVALIVITIGSTLSNDWTAGMEFDSATGQYVDQSGTDFGDFLTMGGALCLGSAALWGLTLVGISAGVFSGLWWRQSMSAVMTAAFSVIGLFMVMSCAWVCGVSTILGASGGSNFEVCLTVVFCCVGPVGLFIIAPLMSARGLVRRDD